MNFSRLLTLLSALALLAPAARARLGESEKQCENRYGTPTGTDVDPLLGDQKSVLYKKNGFVIRITFLNGRAGSIRFEKEDRSAITQDQIRLLLQFNSNGAEWRQTLTEKDGVLGWDRQDGKGEATASADRKFLVIATAEFKLSLRAKAAGVDGF
jgi:hypothetical protein